MCEITVYSKKTQIKIKTCNELWIMMNIIYIQISIYICLWSWEKYSKNSKSKNSDLKWQNERGAFRKFNLLPAGGIIWSNSFKFVLFQIFLIIALSSSLHVSIGPVVLIWRFVLHRANRVALNMTVPSLFSGMFIDTSFLQATRCGHSLPKPSGGEIFLNNVITSKCLIRPLDTHFAS